MTWLTAPRRPRSIGRHISQIGKGGPALPACCVIACGYMLLRPSQRENYEPLRHPVVFGELRHDEDEQKANVVDILIFDGKRNQHTGYEYARRLPVGMESV